MTQCHSFFNETQSRLTACLPVLLFASACGSSVYEPANSGNNSENDSSPGRRGALNAEQESSSLASDPGEEIRSDRIRYNGKDLYLSGFNIAWFNFANDVGSGLNESRLRSALEDLSVSGGNTLRWWIHTDGSSTPQWGEVEGRTRVVGPGAGFIGDMQRALDIADEYGAHIVPALWSFDMLRDNPTRNPPNEANYELLTNDNALQAYIDNALVPMVKALNKHPALVAWELFNEPENVTEDWFRTDAAFYGGDVPTLAQLQRTQAKMAAAIHQAATDQGEVALVTTGSKSMGKYNSDVGGGTNLYRDDRLIEAADGDPLAVFDFYEPHYYNNEGKNGDWSPFHHSASYWEVDKPIVIGEFYNTEELNVLGEAIAGADMCQRLVEQGYAGGWPWQWNEHAGELKNCLRLVTTP